MTLADDDSSRSILPGAAPAFGGNKVGELEYLVADALAHGCDTLASVEAGGGKPYPIPAGASDHPLGGLGFENWAVELATQEAAIDTFFDHIVVSSGSMLQRPSKRQSLRSRGSRRTLRPRSTSGEIPAGSKVMYCHLGGQPCLPAYAGAPGLG